MQQSKVHSGFPPNPLKHDIIYETVKGFATDVQVANFIESACCVCGLLTNQNDLINIGDVDYNKNVLVPD